MRKDEIGYYNGHRVEMLKFIPTESRRILEIGCGQGEFSKQLKNKDLEIWGIEINADAARIASDVLDHVICGDFNSIYNQLPQSSFDCIILNDVLEHMINPWDAIANAKSLLNKSGKIVSSIPNFRFMSNLIIEILYHGNFKYKEEGGILDDTHIRFFTSKSIIQMYEEQGFKIETHCGINKDNRHKALIFNALTFGLFSDMLYKQFATVVTVTAPQ